MIKSFKHKGLEKFFHENTKKGIQPSHASKLTLILTALQAATVVGDMDAAAWNLHQLHPVEDGVWSLKVNANWRITFRFVERNAEDVDYIDYH